MIDIKPFTEKLDRLSEYMVILIDGHGKSWYIDIETLSLKCDDYTVEEIMRIYFEAGIFLEPSNKKRIDNPRKITFDEWLENTTQMNKRKTHETQSQQSTTINN